MQVDLTAFKAAMSAPHTGRCESWHDTEHAAVVFWRDECLQWLCSRHLHAPCPGCAMHEAIDRSVVKVFCDRCRKLVPGFDTKHSTSGYYRRAAAWVQFFNDHEERVCDNCMFADPRYQKVYGKHEAT